MSKEAKPDAWMPIYIGDWDGDTRHLDCEQDGAYGRLVRWYWRNGPPPDDDNALSRIVGMTLARWRKQRPVLVLFFRIVDGRWTHKRVDEELVRWSEKRAKAIARAAAGGRAKAARNPASSTPQALLKHCTSASAAYAEGPNSPSALSGQVSFFGPEEVRAAFVGALGEDWTASYIDRCAWQDLPERGLIPATETARRKINSEGRRVLADLGLKLVEKAA
jgi:uncharacterized protein YdaU (DUF1376 family)